ncbi:peptide-methionine (S)-S-oxide reductase MsrA [Porticoccaceae bacterium]|nr:peptide-methionine (S)-S-oxide reductase MsrA [Porticoccaceae bacterium]
MPYSTPSPNPASALFAVLISFIAILAQPAFAVDVPTEELLMEENVAIFAGGCFWCMESDFEKLDGVKTVVSGYIGGHVANPQYREVSAGTTGHTEAVRIVFDKDRISFEQLLEHFWVNVDPVDGGGQFCDRGPQYRSELFYLSEAQKIAAQRSLQLVTALGIAPERIATKITAASQFYRAEAYHQDYYKKNPKRYSYYRWSCGRDKRLKDIWGD